MIPIVKEGDLIEGEITALAFGGEGILRYEGLVIFVPFTAIGDQLVCRITQRKKNFAYAELIEILQESPHRIKPACPHFGVCGGCQLQHLNYKAQLEHKHQCLEDGLKRIGKLPIDSIPPIIAAKAQWAYRRHITLTLKGNTEGTFSIGYIATDNRSLIQINQCPIFTSPTDPIINQISEFAHKLTCSSTSEGKAMILKSDLDNKYLFSFHFQRLPDNAIELSKKAINLYENWSGIFLKAPGFFQSFGLIATKLIIDDLSISFSPGAFLQNHPEQSTNIYRTIRKIAKEAKQGTVLDLYCGIGITSLMMAKDGKTVIGVESNAEAIKLAKQNAKLNNIESASFIQGDVKNVLAKLLKKDLPVLAVINPPREGLEKSVIKALIEGKTEEMIYVSCMPTTLARDLKELCQENYQIVFCQGYDMFPQTGHVETLVHLKHSRDRHKPIPANT